MGMLLTNLVGLVTYIALRRNISKVQKMARTIDMRVPKEPISILHIDTDEERAYKEALKANEHRGGILDSELKWNQQDIHCSYRPSL